LEDEELLDGIADNISSSESSASQKVSVLRALSALRIRHERLISETISCVASLHKIHEKDAISLLISLAELDVDAPELTVRLWDGVDNHKLSISHDDEYGLLFAALWLPTKVGVIDRIVAHARSQNRIRKRIQLLVDGIHYGLVHRKIVSGVHPSEAPKIRRSQTRKSGKLIYDANDGSVSSGLHMEVANVLSSMKLVHELEVPASSFIIDTVVHS
jgi:hypothetical protein